VGIRVAERKRSGIRAPTVVGLTVGLAGIGAAFAIRAVTPRFGPWSLPNQVQDLLTLSISVIIESLPFVILGILLSILVQVWIPDHWIMRILPRNAALRRAVISLLGIFLPVCECGNVPLARGLIVKGFTVSESMTFLLAAPIVNPITILTTGQAFGFDSGIFLARLVGGFAIANIVGWLFSRHPNQDGLLTDGGRRASNSSRGRAASSCRPSSSDRSLRASCRWACRERYCSGSAAIPSGRSSR
jgi:uncharacterized membrane protein YraQ (UPF0718 family)